MNPILLKERQPNQKHQLIYIGYINTEIYDNFQIWYWEHYDFKEHIAFKCYYVS